MERFEYIAPSAQEEKLTPRPLRLCGSIKGDFYERIGEEVVKPRMNTDKCG